MKVCLKKSKKLSLFYIVILLVGLYISNNKLQSIEDALNKEKYQGVNELNKDTFLLRGIGMKKVGLSFYWVKQILEVGSNNPSKITIITNLKRNYENMLHLDPYFINNYILSGTTLGFIKTYSDKEFAEKIYLKGISFNKGNKLLNHYYLGLIASKNHNMKGVLENLKEIASTSDNYLLIGTISELLQKQYLKENTRKNFLEDLYFIKKLNHSKNIKDKEKAVKELEILKKVNNGKYKFD